MWPRRDGRGDGGHGAPPSRRTAALQCGRGAMAAVTLLIGGIIVLAILLQCGRGAMAAVTWTRSSATAAPRSLQCGRGAMAAVTGRKPAYHRVGHLASMWPRRDGRGDNQSRSRGSRRGPASMWPRRDGRGDRSSWRSSARPQQASMWPRRDGRGDLRRGLDVEPTAETVLQCGRGAMAAVTRQHRPQRDRHRRFNVAAARWPR